MCSFRPFLCVCIPLIWLVPGSAQPIEDFEFPERCILVLGSEGGGPRHLTSELADFSVYIEMLGRIDSLNVSQAAAVALYQARQSRSKALSA